RVALQAHRHRRGAALTGERAARKVGRARLDAAIDGRMYRDSHDVLLGSNCERQCSAPCALEGAQRSQKVTTERIDSPLCIRSKVSLIFSSGMTCVISSSILIFFSMYQSTILGTSLRPRAPPKAVPFHTRPVTSWKGRVLISWPAPATPMMTETPQPRWQHSSARLIRFTFPTHSKL